MYSYIWDVLLGDSVEQNFKIWLENSYLFMLTFNQFAFLLINHDFNF